MTFPQRPFGPVILLYKALRAIVNSSAVLDPHADRPAMAKALERTVVRFVVGSDEKVVESTSGLHHLVATPFGLCAVISSFLIPIPLMVMVNAALVAFPIAVIKHLSVVTWRDPSSASVRWTSPITAVPFVMVSDGIPITRNPSELGPRPWRRNANHSRSRRRSYSDSDRNLSAEY